MSQIIYAVDIDDQLATFGYSLSSGLDMDNNGYPGEFTQCVFIYYSQRSITLSSVYCLEIRSVNQQKVTNSMPEKLMHYRKNIDCY